MLPPWNPSLYDVEHEKLKLFASRRRRRMLGLKISLFLEL
jgi:hypothetical protein